MANIFNADNGVVSGSAGIKLSSDTSGVLNIQTNGTTAISVSSSQVVSFPATSGISFGGQITFAAGTAAAPSISVTGDTNTGIYFPGADQVAVSTGGVQRVLVDASGVTTLAANPIFNAGTANGVVYLNGSKSATSGTALTFDGSASYPTFKIVGTQEPSIYLQFGIGYAQWYNSYGNIGLNAFLSGEGKSLNSQVIYFAGYNNTADASLQLFDGKMRIAGNGNVGIGTASPGQKLDVNGVARVSTEIRVKNTVGNVSYLTFEENATSTSYTFISGDARTSGYMGFWTNNTERMRLDSSGNFLINTSAAASPGLTVATSKNISFSEGAGAGQSLATIFRQANSADLILGSAVAYSNTANGFASSFSGAWARSAISVGYGAVRFLTAPEATVAVGTDVTLTERARITSSGYQFGLGTASPSSNGGSGSTVMHLHNPTVGEWSINHYTTGTTGAAAADGTIVGVIADEFYIYNYENSNIRFGTNNAERVRITSGGDLLVGTSSVYGKLSVYANSNGVNDVWIRNDSAGSSSQCGVVLNASGNSWRMGMGSTANNSNALTWNVDVSGANTERMRLTTGGNLLVGTTSDATVNATTARTNISGNLNVTGYTQTSLFQTGLVIPDTGDPSNWCRLGRINTSQGGAVVHIRVYFHTGFNASVAQTGMADILFKTSNGSSSTAGSTGPFYGDVVTYSYGYAGIGIIRVIQNSTDQYDFFLFLGSYTNGSIYTVDVTSPTTWTHFGNIQTPSGNYIDSGIRNVAYS